MHYCRRCGARHQRRGHLTRHYARKHPIAMGLAWLILGLPALAVLALVAVVYVIAWLVTLVLTGGKMGAPRGHFR